MREHARKKLCRPHPDCRDVAAVGVQGERLVRVRDAALRGLLLLQAMRCRHGRTRTRSLSSIKTHMAHRCFPLKLACLPGGTPA